MQLNFKLRRFLLGIGVTFFMSMSFCSLAQIQEKIRGEHGLIRYITHIAPSEQFAFNPLSPKTNILGDSESDLILMSSEVDPLGNLNYRFKQTYHQIPVENSMLIIQTRQGMVTCITGNIILEFPGDMSERELSSLNSQASIELAKKGSEGVQFAWESSAMESRLQTQMEDAQATYLPSPHLVWYNNGDEINPEMLRLCYKVDIYSIEPLSRAYYFVDANSGKVLGKNPVLCNIDAVGTALTAYSGSVSIHSDNTSGTSYRLRDLTKGNGIITLTSAGADYTNGSADWALTGANQYALDAHYGVSQTYAYYFNVFGRNSVNNAGLALYSYVNESATVDNAYWDGTSMHFGNRSSNGAGITAIDVDAHELTHGLTQYTSNLTYSNQSGAMNESMSDIFGKTVQFWSKPNDINWLMSNDMGWNIRNMANPNAYSQPDTYLGTYWYTGTADNGGVHTNSGVGNFMYYLLVTGGTGVNDIGNSYTVLGIGLTDAAAIIYRTNTVYLTSSSNYSAWRTACISAATDLFGATSNQVNQVMNAWYAVGIGAAAPTGTCAVPSGLNSSAVGDNVATLSWTSQGDASSYNVQYKASSSTSWTTTSATTNTINLSGLLSGTTYTYQVQANCTSGGFTNYSASSTFTTTGVAPIIYCTSVGQSLDGIANVTFNTISNTTALNAYTDYTGSISTTVSTGTTYPLTVKINTGGNYTNYTKAWIDWNHDGVFSTTTEEYNLGTAVNVTSGNTSLSPLNITVPTGAFIGTTRMRVSTQYASNPTPCLASFDGEVEDYAINVILGSSCSTPSGLTSSGVNGTVATVSWTSTGAASYNLQYKLSSATTWTSVSNITANSYALSGLTPCSTYNFQVQAVCGTTTSALSTSASFTTAGCTNYCASYGTNQTREYIKRVTLGTINNTTGANTGGYGNYTTLSTNLTGGSTYTISLLPGFVSSSRREYFRVYIDYNRNGSFETAELIGSVNGTSATTALTKSFTIPTSALNGPTRMRVQMQYNAYPTTACSVFTYGEVEDYTVTIQGNTYFGSESAETEEVIDETSFLTLYPNPTNQELNVQIASVQSGIAQVRIFDLSGSMMKSHQLAVNAGVMNVKLDVSDLSNGIYLLEIQGCDRLETKRFIVQH